VASRVGIVCSNRILLFHTAHGIEMGPSVNVKQGTPDAVDLEALCVRTWPGFSVKLIIDLDR